VGAQTSSGSTGSPGQLRSQLTQLRRQLEAVKNDDKIDCKTKDAEMQSLQAAIAAIEQQISARSAQAQKTTTTSTATQNDKAAHAADPSATRSKRSGALVDLYV
jgi:uncharacterized protein involved in exopolysaccharide biosynthesis